LCGGCAMMRVDRRSSRDEMCRCLKKQCSEWCQAVWSLVGLQPCCYWSWKDRDDLIGCSYLVRRANQGEPTREQ
jgi:hypothetical protein